MKHAKIAALCAGFTLMVAASIADARTSNTCYTQFLKCRSSGVSYAECYARHEDCLAANHCPIP
ncbi:MAG: hypothetical protein ACTHOH_12460 [Lysobacteraceae bacterium]